MGIKMGIKCINGHKNRHKMGLKYINGHKNGHKKSDFVQN